MSGKSHTTRTPHRMNDVLKRDERGYIARQRVANADLRKVIYVSPAGKGYHKVMNPVSREVYIVADGLGGGTMAPGSAAMAASFSGQHGEVLISRPPAGFGGASIVNVELPPNRTPPVPVEPGTFSPMGFTWDPSNNRAIVARLHDFGATEIVEFVKIPRANIPYLDPGTGVAFATLEADAIYAIQMGSSSNFYVWSALAGVGRVTRFNNSGDVLEDKAWYPPDNITSAVQTVFYNGYLYSMEAQEGTAPGGGPPFDQWTRIVKRDPSTIEIVAAYNIPNISSIAGMSVRYTSPDALLNVGSLRLYLNYVRTPLDGTFRSYYQDLTADLDLSGSAVAFPGNPLNGSEHSFGAFRSVKPKQGGGVVFTESSGLYKQGIGSGSLETILASHDDDGGYSFGLEQISSTEYLIMGSATLFTLSIIGPNGQELPTP